MCNLAKLLYSILPKVMWFDDEDEAEEVTEEVVETTESSEDADCGCC